MSFLPGFRVRINLAHSFDLESSYLQVTMTSASSLVQKSVTHPLLRPPGWYRAMTEMGAGRAVSMAKGEGPFWVDSCASIKRRERPEPARNPAFKTTPLIGRTGWIPDLRHPRAEGTVALLAVIRAIESERFAALPREQNRPTRAAIFRYRQAGVGMTHHNRGAWHGRRRSFLEREPRCRAP